MTASTTPILLVDTPEKNADLRYASGFWAPDALVYLHTAHGSHLVVSALEQGRAQQLAERERWRRLKIWTPDQLKLKGIRRRSLGEWAAALLRATSIGRVQVPGSFPLGAARKLAARGITVTLATGVLFPRRACKRPDEIEKIRASQIAAAAAMRAARACLRGAAVGAAGWLRRGRRRLEAEDVKQVIHLALLAHDTMCRDVIVAPGRQAADPHERGHGPLRAGEMIVLDIFPQHLTHGYWGDLTRTVIRGRPTPEQSRMYAAVKAAQAAALRAIAPGARLATVHRSAAGVLERRGFETGVVAGLPQGFIHSTGHGVGLEIHEGPSLAPVVGALRQGHVVTVEPGLYYPDQGGVRIEDTVVVVRGGWRLLTPCPHGFEL